MAVNLVLKYALTTLLGTRHPAMMILIGEVLVKNLMPPSFHDQYKNLSLVLIVKFLLVGGELTQEIPKHFDTKFEFFPQWDSACYSDILYDLDGT